MIVEDQVTQLLTWNFARSVKDLRYLLDWWMWLFSFIALFWRNNQEICNKGQNLLLLSWIITGKALNHSISFICCQLFRLLYPRKCFAILQFYICLAVLYKIICLQFFICILLFVLFYVFVIRESPSVRSSRSFITKTSESDCSRTPSPYSSHQQWLWPDLTREWNKMVLRICHFQNALSNPWFGKQGATMANFILCHQKIFVPKNWHWNSCTFMQMIRELFE